MAISISTPATASCILLSITFRLNNKPLRSYLDDFLRRPRRIVLTPREHAQALLLEYATHEIFHLRQISSQNITVSTLRRPLRFSSLQNQSPCGSSSQPW